MFTITHWFGGTPPQLWVQESGLDFPIFDPQSIDPARLVQFMIGLAILIGILIYGTFKYRKWKRFKEFELEMKTLGLDPESEGAFADMVRRYKFSQPVNVIYSPRLFDEMATSELERILSSPGSQQAKENFVNTVYEIRSKTYQPEWSKKSDDYENGYSANGSSTALGMI